MEQSVGAPSTAKIGCAKRPYGKSVHGSKSAPVALLYVFATSSADGHG